MRARLVEANFERGDMDPKTRIGIGLGPAQHIKKFEKIMDEFNFEYEREDPTESYETYTWVLNDADFGPLVDKTIFLHPVPNREGKIGWFFRPLSHKYYDDPYPIIEFIVQSVLYDMSNELDSIKKSIQYYEERIVEIKGDAKRLKINI